MLRSRSARSFGTRARYHRGVRALLLIVCVGCRFSWSAHMGAPPRATNDIKLALYAADETAATMAHAALQPDPHVTLLDVDAAAIDKEKVVSTGCAWANAHGAEYFALATAGARYSSSYECTSYKFSLSAKHDECAAGHETNQMSIATYTLDVYDAKTCQDVRALSTKVGAYAGGEEAQSRPEALAKLASAVRAKAEGLPEQAFIGPDGRVVADEPHDGTYALYEDGAYAGYVTVTNAGTPAERIHPLYCCIAPGPGDALVERGRRKFLDLALTGVFSIGPHFTGPGVGAHVRHYALDGGLQLGVGGDLVTSSDYAIALVTGEVGWGFPIAPGFVVSPNVGVGWAQVGPRGDTTGSRDVAAQVTPRVRVQTFLATWWYAALDVGYVVTGAIPSVGLTDTQRATILRLNLGFDL
jgi:hypothetical protein